MSTWVSPYFSSAEMACSHCGEDHMDSAFMNKLTQLREAYGAPMTISSGYRCEDHPIEAKKTRPGAHASGRAADIAVDRADALGVLKIALESKMFTGVGIAQKGSGRFIHLDDLDEDSGFPRPTIWSY
uniref:Peptidase M15 n=1 Tax=Candidatus Kentrum sp. LFY TaxID=2126342 RepID=A0A450UE75_9GAMM|nr:MAG: Peptidase M15 [Candidatus Kentron sp. LFY]